MAKTLAVRVIDNSTAIAVIGRQAPSDEDWDVLVKLSGGPNPPQRALVVTGGGGPTPKQRRAILDVTGGKGLPAAVLTDSQFVRGIATAISWFVPDVRAFAPADLQSALNHLKVGMPVEAVQKVINDLKKELLDASAAAKTG